MSDVVSDDAIPVRNMLVNDTLIVSDTAVISDHRLITAVVRRPLQIESSVFRLARRNFSKFYTTTFESMLSSSELVVSHETEVDNFADQLERVVTSAQGAISARLWLNVGVWNVAGYARVVLATEKNFADAAVTLTDSSMSPDVSGVHLLI